MGLRLALHFAERGHGDFGKGNAGLRGMRARGKLGETHDCLQCRSEDSGCDPNKQVYAWMARRTETAVKRAGFHSKLLYDAMRIAGTSAAKHLRA